MFEIILKNNFYRVKEYAGIRFVFARKDFSKDKGSSKQMKYFIKNPTG
jgi:hypothetical protein